MAHNNLENNSVESSSLENGSVETIVWKTLMWKAIVWKTIMWKTIVLVQYYEVAYIQVASGKGGSSGWHVALVHNIRAPTRALFDELSVDMSILSIFMKTVNGQDDRRL